MNIEIEKNRKFRIFDLKGDEIYGFELKDYDEKIEDYKLLPDSGITSFEKVNFLIETIK